MKAVFDPEKKISMNHSLPEAFRKPDDGLQAVDESERDHKRHLFGLSRKTEFSILVLLIVVVLAATGIGIGVGLTKKTHRSPPARTDAARYAHRYYMSTFLKLIFRSTSSPSSQPSVVSASNHLILNDSSLAALGLNGGDRALLFQDRIGIIRQATYKLSATKWSTTPSPVVASGPRNSTPLALLHNPNTTNEAVILLSIVVTGIITERLNIFSRSTYSISPPATTLRLWFMILSIDHGLTTRNWLIREACHFALLQIQELYLPKDSESRRRLHFRYQYNTRTHMAI